jgi:hypothetical protein
MEGCYGDFGERGETIGKRREKRAMISFDLSNLVFFAVLLAGKSQTAKSGDDGYIESEIVPPSGVVRLIDPDRMVEKAYNKRQRRYPSMPNPHKESCGIVFTAAALRKAAKEVDYHKEKK